MQHLFGQSVHTAFVVPDFDGAVSRMLGSGFGPAFLLRRLAMHGRFRGQRHDMVMNVAFFAVGDVFFEYIEQVDGSRSAYSEFLEHNPQGGMHHIAYYSSDFAADLARSKRAGVTLDVVEELLTEDGATFEIYAEPTGRNDAVLTQLMYPGASEVVFATMEDVARHWDGSEPLRDLYRLMPPEISLASA
jgi:catechol 2,3-dioxygenase-like lactoylglutathione lyase family enzyme